MWVESEEGVGSTFFVTIIARGSMQPSTGRSLSPGEILHRPPTAVVGKKALLVGTRGAFHRMVGSMLRAWGVEVSSATTVEELDALASGRGSDVSISEANSSADPSPSGAGERVSVNQERVSREGVGTSREGVTAIRERVSANGFGGRLERMDVDQGGSFDLFVVDSPVAGRVFDTRKLEALMAENRGAIELMHRACSLGRGTPTVLLTSKNTRNVFQFDMEAMVRYGRAQKGASFVLRYRPACLHQPCSYFLLLPLHLLLASAWNAAARPGRC